jgi:hypothetical protein
VERVALAVSVAAAGWEEDPVAEGQADPGAADLAVVEEVPEAEAEPAVAEALPVSRGDGRRPRRC